MSTSEEESGADALVTQSPAAETATTVAAGVLAPWEMASLPQPPMAGWKLWVGLIGPGVVLAGMSIGTGEWLFGPGVSAQYGATLFWLALTSIMMQAFCNLMVMRYAIYCGEPVIVGVLRTWPGPVCWMGVFAILDFAAIWPYNASNAAVPLATAILGRLPRPQSDDLLVTGLGVGIFLLAFVPLIFGGTVYRMIEKIFTAKLVLVLGYLTVVAVLLVSAPVFWDVVTGFTAFGDVPLPADTLIHGRQFNLKETAGDTTLLLRGTWERATPKDEPTATGDLIIAAGEQRHTVNLRTPDEKIKDLQLGDRVMDKEEVKAVRQRLLARTRPYEGSEKFFLQMDERGQTLVAEGTVVRHHYWQAEKLTVGSGQGARVYTALADVPQPYRSRLENHLKHEGQARVGMFGYWREHGRLPDIDWALIVGFIAIAGAGGLTNTMFSNYARDKGWGMGRHVGAIPSAIGGVSVDLSHTGKVFAIDEASLPRWRGWMRHIYRDQSIWIAASIIGMALPCMMSLEFIRNATVTDTRMAAMSAEGIALRYPSVGPLLWFLTLFCGFLVLAPGQVSAADQIARRWTDLIWSARAGKRHNRSVGNGHQDAPPEGREDVRYVYYGILAGYCVFGLITLTSFSPVKIAKISTVLQNIALGASALLGLYVNRVLMPKQLQPGWFHQIGTIACGIFFLGVSSVLLVLWVW
jgi:hypothetical protein